MTPEESRKEELRPCPFCGRSSQPHSDGIKCLPCTVVREGPYSLHEWQNAYCWKEIDSLREGIKKLRSAMKEALLGAYSNDAIDLEAIAMSVLKETATLMGGEERSGEKL